MEQCTIFNGLHRYPSFPSEFARRTTPYDVDQYNNGRSCLAIAIQLAVYYVLLAATTGQPIAEEATYIGLSFSLFCKRLQIEEKSRCCSVKSPLI
jgi:hypothetical protein